MSDSDPNGAKPANAGGDPMRWLWRGFALVALLGGWLFILFHNKFNITTPVVIVCLGYLAVVAMLLNLWRVGAAAVAPEDATQEAWARPLGARADLEKEKRTLLKAIKEAEFDQAMGKLSKKDCDELITMYRARAIEVIKELDRLDSGEAGTPRERIKREVAARLALEQENKKDKKGKGKSEPKPKVEEQVAKEASKDEEPAAKPEPVAAKSAEDGKSDAEDSTDSADSKDSDEVAPPEPEKKAETTEATS